MSTSKRPAIPAKIREKILTEFHHKCAICGKEKPHIHHIDENRKNNSEENLIPLCPNCHLIDQHSPTTPVDHKKLELFRRFKDPAVLDSKFEPLFRRLKYIFEIESYSHSQAKQNGKELVAFVSALEMGTFYGVQLSECILLKGGPRIFSEDTTEQEFQELAKEEWQEFLVHVLKFRDKAISLCIELLRYQNW